MTEPDAAPVLPEPAEVRAALDRVLANDLMRGSPQLGTFLRFVVEAVLRGEQDHIKGYTIAVEAFGRDKKFDPQIDPIVRVEATRLRRTLERYYAGPGADDPVIIELARGSYVPILRKRPALAAPAVTPAPAAWSAGWRAAFAAACHPVVLASLATVIVAAGIVTMLLPSRPGETVTAPPPAATMRQPAASPPAARGRVPVLAVGPFDVRGSPAAATRAGYSALAEKLRDAFARFDSIEVVSMAAGQPVGLDGKPVGIDYRLGGTIETRSIGGARISFRLLDNRDGTVAWSRAFDPVETSTEDEIVLELATTLLQPFGVIRARERVRQLAGDVGDPHYRCIVEASEAFRSFDPKDHHRARLCLEELTRLDPGYSLGFSYLATIYYREYLFGFDPLPDQPPALDRALKMARRAIELQPESARNYHLLSTVLFGRREVKAAFAALDKAIELNPYDLTILADYGGRLVTTGEIVRGLSMMRKADRFGIVHPSWHHFYLFLGSYLMGDIATATHEAHQITSDTYSLGLVARALTAAANDDPAQARQAIEKLVALSPAWRDDPKAELARFFPADFIVKRLAHDLASAGLTVSQ